MSSNDQIDLLGSEKKIYFDILFQSVLPFFLCISVKRLKLLHTTIICKTPDCNNSYLDFFRSYIAHRVK